MRGLGISIPGALLNKVLQGQGVTIPEVLTSEEMAAMGTVWNDARNYASFSEIPWASLGYPNGPPLSGASKAALSYVWSQIRVAARWTDPRWDFHRIPASIVAAALPPPELPSSATPAPPTPAPAPVPSAPIYSPTSNYTPADPFANRSQYSNDAIPDDAAEGGAPAPQAAGLFSGSIPPWLLGLVAVGLAMPIILPGKPARRTRRR